MKFTYNWLKDYLKIRISSEKLANELTMSGLEIKSIEKHGSDFVFEAEVTPNRPDCLSIIGVAREICALTGEQMSLPKTTPLKNKKLKEKVNFNITDVGACSRYLGLIIRGVQVAESPVWLKERLLAIGLRPVNNIVDITNFCLFELGQPIHAFDLDKLSGGIQVRFAREAEELITIDGVKRSLNKEVLVISDRERVAAIAGIMGGKYSEVDLSTKNVFVELAFFNPRIIRKAVRMLALSSDSSYRFERTVDSENLLNVASRVLGLILELGGKKCFLAGMGDFGKKSGAHRKISLDIDNLNKILGIKASKADVERIICALGLTLKKKTKSVLVFEVPSFRPDLKIEEDLIEEFSRIYGFDKIPDSIPHVMPKSVKGAGLYEFKDLIRENLLRQGLNEIITYGLISEKLVKDTNFYNENLSRLANPLSLDAEVLRPSLIPGALSVLKHNINRENQNLKVFEIGDIFQESEMPHLCIALSGECFNIVSPEGNTRLNSSIYYLKGILENLGASLGVEKVSFEVFEMAYFVKSQGFLVKFDDAQVGVLGIVNQNVLLKMDIKSAKVFIAELDVDKLRLLQGKRLKFSPLEIYPAIARDISMSISEVITFGQIESLVKGLGLGCLKDIKLVDYYTGKHIRKGHKGLTLSIKYQAKDHTLTEEEIAPLHKQVLDRLISEFKIEQR